METKKSRTILHTAIILSFTLVCLTAITQIKSELDPFGSLVGKPKPITQLKIPILVYHYVEYVTDERDFIRESLNIPPHIFEAQIKTLKEAGYTFITPSEIASLLESTENQDKKYVVLSFDDGYEDFYTDAFPILKRNNVKAVAYIVNNFVGYLNYMKENQIEEIAQSGLVEIGSHTLGHAGLPSLEKDIAYNEIYLSKKRLEERYGVNVVSFAYPYGSYNESVKELVKKAGFTSAVTMDEGNVVTKSVLFELKRLRPGYLVGEELLKYIE